MCWALGQIDRRSGRSQEGPSKVLEIQVCGRPLWAHPTLVDRDTEESVLIRNSRQYEWASTLRSPRIFPIFYRIPQNLPDQSNETTDSSMWFVVSFVAFPSRGTEHNYIIRRLCAPTPGWQQQGCPKLERTTSWICSARCDKMETEIGAQFIERELRTDGDDRPVLIMNLATLDKPLEGCLRDGAGSRTGVYAHISRGLPPRWGIA